MADSLSAQRVAEILDNLKAAVAKDDCLTCECLQGFLAQLEMDAGDDARDLIAPLKVSTERMHGCLGCEPCGPGTAFTDYVKGRAS